MAKINATYSSGYYISPDTDFRRLEEQQAADRKRQRTSDDPSANVKRQTFAIPFDLYCDHCKRRIPRQAHVYANRRATDRKYLGAIRIWELEIRCQYCSEHYYLETDPETAKETGGYKCVRGCRRAEGDYYAINKANEAVRAQWAKDHAEVADNPLAALERENEATRQLAEHNRQVIEDVMDRADGAGDEALLAALRQGLTRTPQATSTSLSASTRTLEEEADEERQYQSFEARWAAMTPASSSYSSSSATAPLVSTSLRSMQADDNAVAEAMQRYARAGGSSTTPSVHPTSSAGVRVPTTRNTFVVDDEDDDDDDMLPHAVVRKVDMPQEVAKAQPPAAGVGAGIASPPTVRGSLLSELFDDDED